MERPQYIEHPDLTKLADDELWLEVQYLREHATSISEEIRQGLSRIGAGQKLTVPIRKNIEDCQLCLSRYEAICEEIGYRKQMMR